MALPTTAYSLALLSEYIHSLDSLPLDLSRNFADLRELDAVLSSSMTLITSKITKLTSMIEDCRASPEERLWLLSEIGDEAQRLKLGGEDKIRVAGAAADNLKNHKHHLLDLLHYLPNFDPTVLNRNTVYPHVTTKSYPPLSQAETGRRRRGGNLTTSGYTNGLDASPSKRRRSAKDEDIDIGSGKTPRREKANDTGNANRARNGARGGRRTDRGASPSESVVSVTSHVPIPSHSRQHPSHNASRNGNYATNPNKRSGLASVPSNATEQYEITARGGGRELYSNQPPTSSSLHPSLPMPYAATTQNMPGAEWAALNHTQLEGPGMPVARGNSHPLGLSMTVPLIATPIEQVDSGVGPGDAEADGDDNKTYCFCNRVSFGEMIACDDSTCDREWFHLECIGLTVTPDGTWYCEACRAKRNKQKAGRGGRRKTTAGKNGTKP